jgi:hypothetical protein
MTSNETVVLGRRLGMTSSPPPLSLSLSLSDIYGIRGYAASYTWLQTAYTRLMAPSSQSILAHEMSSLCKLSRHSGSDYTGSTRHPLNRITWTASSSRYQTASSDKHKPVSPDTRTSCCFLFKEFSRFQGYYMWSELFQATNLVCPERFWDNRIIPCWWRQRNSPKHLTSELTQLVF